MGILDDINALRATTDKSPEHGFQSRWNLFDRQGRRPYNDLSMEAGLVVDGVARAAAETLALGLETLGPDKDPSDYVRTYGPRLFDNAFGTLVADPKVQSTIPTEAGR